MPPEGRPTPRGKIRSNVSKACLICRSRKAKCDGNQPCSRCIRLKNQCDYGDDGRKGNVYHNQLSTARDEVRRLRALVEGSNNNNDSPGDDEQSMSPPHQERMMTHSPESPSYSNPTSGLIVDPRSGQRVHFGSSSFHPILAETNNPYRLSPGPSLISGLTFSDLTPTIHSELLDLYFTYINGCYGYIDERAFRRSLEDPNAKSPTYSKFLHLAILSLAAHLSHRLELRSQPDDPASAGIGFRTEALDMSSDEINNPTPESCLGFSILCHSTGDNAQSSLTWVNAGISGRLAQHLGLHLSDKPGEDTEFRDMVMWSSFCSDKLQCLYTGRLSSLRLEDQDLYLLPLDKIPRPLQSAAQMNAAVQVSIAHLYILAARVLNDIYGVQARRTPAAIPVVETLSEALTRWSLTIPIELQDTYGGIRSQLPPVIFMHTLYRSLRVLLFRPFLRHPSSIGKLARKECFDSALRLADLVGLYSAVHEMRKGILSFTHNIYTASSALLLLFVDEDIHFDRRIISTAIQKCLDALRGLSKSWRIPDEALLALHTLARGCLEGNPSSEAEDLLRAMGLAVTPKPVESAVEQHVGQSMIQPNLEQPPSFETQFDEFDFATFMADEAFLLPTLNQWSNNVY